MRKRKGHNVIKAYKKLLKDDQDWDYSFLLSLERKKLQRMAECFSKEVITVNDATTAKELSLCVRLLDIVLDMEAFRDKWSDEVCKHIEYNFLKNDDGITYSLETEYKGTVPDFPVYVNIRNASRFVSPMSYPKETNVSDEEQKYWTEHFKEDVRSAKAWHLYNLIREYKMFSWWN